MFAGFDCLPIMRAGLLWIAVFFLPAAVGEVPEESVWYAGIQVPMMFVADADADVRGRFDIPVAGSLEYRARSRTSHDIGYRAGGFLGYRSFPWLRLESEIFHARAEVSRVHAGDLSLPALDLSPPDRLAVPVSGSVSHLGGSVNCWIDIPLGGGWKPYFGGGVGAIRVSQRDVALDTRLLADTLRQGLDLGFAPTIPELSSRSWALLHHAGAGVAWEIAEVVVPYLGYRFQMTDDLTYRGVVPGASIKSRGKLRVHYLEVGVRFHF